MSVITSNEYLTLEQMTVNAQYIHDKLIVQGWSRNAICGMLGNIQTESTINSGLWESQIENNMAGGFGLVQWTPATKFTDWATANGFSWTDIDGQIARILYEVENGLQWGVTENYPMTFTEFIVSTETPSYLAQVFIANYERPLDPNQPIRSEQAVYWYENLTGTPEPEPAKNKKGMPLFMYRLF